MQFLVTLVQLSFLLRVIWQNVEGLAKKPTSGTLDTIWEVTGTKLPVLPVPPGHPVSKQNADVDPLFYPSYAILYFFSFLAGTSTPFFLSYIYLPKHIHPHLPLPYPNHLLSCLHHFLQYPYHIHPISLYLAPFLSTTLSFSFPFIATSNVILFPPSPPHLPLCSPYLHAPMLLISTPICLTLTPMLPFPILIMPTHMFPFPIVHTPMTPFPISPIPTPSPPPPTMFLSPFPPHPPPCSPSPLPYSHHHPPHSHSHIPLSHVPLPHPHILFPMFPSLILIFLFPMFP